MLSANRPNKNGTKRSGFTLVETLFSAAIIAMVLMGVLAIFVQTVEMSKKIKYEYLATNITKNRIERARTFVETSGFAMLTAADFDETDKLLDSDGDPDIDGDFKRSTEVNTNYGGEPRLTRIGVTVIYRYKGEWKDDASVEATTIFSDLE